MSPEIGAEVYRQIPEAWANLEQPAERRRVVQFDARGHGLSARDVTDFSLEARVCASKLPPKK